MVLQMSVAPLRWSIVPSLSSFDSPFLYVEQKMNEILQTSRFSLNLFFYNFPVLAWYFFSFRAAYVVVNETQRRNLGPNRVFEFCKIVVHEFFFGMVNEDSVGGESIHHTRALNDIFHLVATMLLSTDKPAYK